MIWKIYFFILSLLYTAYMVAAILYPEAMELESIDYFDLGFALLALVGVFGYAFRRTVLSKNVWKLYLPFIILWDIGFATLRNEWIGGKDLMYEIMALIIIVLTLIPQYVALFRYGFRSAQLWEPYNKSLK
jgi:hypothetical protein